MSDESYLVKYRTPKFHDVPICAVSNEAEHMGKVGCVAAAQELAEEEGVGPLNPAQLSDICRQHLDMFRQTGYICGCTPDTDDTNGSKECRAAVKKLNEMIP